MQNPFLISRFVLFALLVNLNLLILAFAAWNANATVLAGLPVPVTTIFFILNSCTLFFCIILGLAELVVPQANIARILVECLWSAVLSVFQTGTAISVTVNNPAICRLTSNWDLCASSSLLIPTAWLSSIILFSHFLTMFITAMVHVRLFPDIWNKTVYSIDWFNLGEASRTGRGDITSDDVDSWARYMKDIEAARSHTDPGTKAPWARNIRRGIDAPFKRPNTPSAVTSPSTTLTSLPVAPLRVQSRTFAGSRFLEKFRESSRLSRSESLSQITTQSVDPFPPRVENHDLPIPLPRLSEWIRADAIKGINVHTIPTSP